MEPTTYRLRDVKLPNPHIIKCLEVSTGHIKKSDNDLLKIKVYDCPLTFYPYEYGYFIHVTEELDETAITEYGFSIELYSLLKIALSLGCKYLQLDADGTTYEDMPTFNW